MPLPYPLNPLGISVRENLPLTFTAVEASTVKLTATGSPTVAGLHYRLGTSGPWIAYTIGTEIPLAAGKKVQFWNSAETLSASSSSYVSFFMLGTIDATGNVMSMLNHRHECVSNCFRRLFYECDALISVPQIPAKTLASYSYLQMFYGCSGLIALPKNLLPATKLATNSYNGMFQGCSALTSTPDLPAKTLATYCYNSMFADCAALTTSPDLPASLLYSACYRRIFLGASALSKIEVAFTAWPSNATEDWLSGVAASGTFIKPAALPEEYGPDRIPEGWTVINK